MALGASATGCADADAQQEEAPETQIVLGAKPSIMGGDTDNDVFSLPGVIALKVGQGSSLELCSGALIAPNVVLTARHCLANSVTNQVSCDENGRSTNGEHVAGNVDPGAVSIYLGSAPRFGQAPNAVATAIISPKGKELCDSDIALVVLDHEITSVDPLSVRLTATVEAGESIRSVGYGQNDKKMPLGTRLRRENVPVLAIGKGISGSNTALGPHEFEVGQSICQGDSGGPALSEDSGAVVGVVSRGGGCDDDYGHIYTTTTGWTELFDEAFALAGGKPTEERLGTRSIQTRRFAPTADTRKKVDEGCSTAATGSGRPDTTIAGFLAVVLAVLGRKRRTRNTEAHGSEAR